VRLLDHSLRRDPKPQTHAGPHPNSMHHSGSPSYNMHLKQPVILQLSASSLFPDSN